MQLVTIDGQDICNKKDLHAHLAKALDFPAYYGGNLDALSDMLTSLQIDTSIQIVHLADLYEHLGEYTDKFLNLLTIVAEKNAFLTILG